MHDKRNSPSIGCSHAENKITITAIDAQGGHDAEIVWRGSSGFDNVYALGANLNFLPETLFEGHPCQAIKKQ